MEIKSLAALVFALFLAPVFLSAQDAPTPPPFSAPSAPPSNPVNPANPVNPVQTSPSPAPSPALQPSAFSLQPSPPPPAPVITARNTTVIDAPRLIAFLPDAPAGWTADKPDGSTSDSTGFPITTVSRVYSKGPADDAPTAAVNIIDSANNQQFQQATKAIWNATGATPDGYDKTVTVAGLPGFEHFANAGQTGVLWIICGGRYFVQIETTRQPPVDLEAWLPRIDLKKLSTLK